MRILSLIHIWEAFDCNIHQAVGRVEYASQYDETVNDVYQKGYRMGGKVLRPAMVTVTYGGETRPVIVEDDDINITRSLTWIRPIFRT